MGGRIDDSGVIRWVGGELASFLARAEVKSQEIPQMMMLYNVEGDGRW